MNAAEKVKLEAAMREKGSRLERDIEELVELTRPEAPDSAIGRVSRMDAINNRSVNEAALRKKRVQLNALNEALKTVDDPHFGTCRRCGKPIPMGRILIMPESRFCTGCASR